MCAGGVCVDDFLDWLWCVVADLVVVWEGSVVVSHHPSYQQPSRTTTTPTHHGCCVVSGGVVRWCGVLVRRRVV